jgi:hypothetical protein
MNEDFGLDVMMEDMLNNGYGYILDAMDNEDYEPDYGDGEDTDDYEDGWDDVDADADTLASAGWGTDEDYGYDGGDGGW